jgi:hypothetical protein
MKEPQSSSWGIFDLKTRLAGGHRHTSSSVFFSFVFFSEDEKKNTTGRR